jgi:hypothetical protein
MLVSNGHHDRVQQALELGRLDELPRQPGIAARQRRDLRVEHRLFLVVQKPGRSRLASYFQKRYGQRRKLSSSW